MDIGVQYLSGLVSPETIETIEKMANENGLDLETRDVSKTVFASASLDTAQFFVLLSPALLQSIHEGLIVSGTYDVIKHIVTTLADQISGKKYTRVSEAKSEEHTAKLFLKTKSSELRIELPANDPANIEKAIKRLIKAHVKS